MAYSMKAKKEEVLKKIPEAEKKKFILKFIKDKGIITEGEMNLVKRRLNDRSYKWEDVEELQDLKITPEQIEKGRAWLMNQYKTPRGVERTNNPFGYREQNVLDNFDRFEFVSFYDASRYGSSFKNYLPVYRVYGKDGDTFEYYSDYEGVHITG